MNKEIKLCPQGIRILSSETNYLFINVFSKLILSCSKCKKEISLGEAYFSRFNISDFENFCFECGAEIETFDQLIKEFLENVKLGDVEDKI